MLPQRQSLGVCPAVPPRALKVQLREELLCESKGVHLFLGGCTGGGCPGIKGWGKCGCSLRLSDFSLLLFAGLEDPEAFGAQLPITPGNRCSVVDYSLSGLARRVPIVQSQSLVCAQERRWVAVAWHSRPHSKWDCGMSGVVAWAGEGDFSLPTVCFPDPKQPWWKGSLLRLGGYTSVYLQLPPAGASAQLLWSFWAGEAVGVM